MLRENFIKSRDVKSTKYLLQNNVLKNNYLTIALQSIKISENKPPSPATSTTSWRGNEPSHNGGWVCGDPFEVLLCV